MEAIRTVEDASLELEADRRALARDPGSLRFAQYADNLRRCGRLIDAAAVCERGLGRHPTYASGHVVMGEIHRDAGRLDQAEAEWLEALRLDPGHPRAHVVLGDVLLRRGERDRAAAAFEAALVYSPGLPEAEAGLFRAIGADPKPAKPRPQQAQGRPPGDRPGWLSDDRLDELVARVLDCACVESAALVAGDGAVLAGRPPGPGGELASLLADARKLLFRLGAGRLRAAVVGLADGAGVSCIPLGEMALIAGFRPGSSLDEAAGQIEDALAGGGNDDPDSR